MTLGIYAVRVDPRRSSCAHNNIGSSECCQLSRSLFDCQKSADGALIFEDLHREMSVVHGYTENGCSFLKGLGHIF